MIFYQTGLKVFLIGFLSIGMGLWEIGAAPTQPKKSKEVPGVETKIKQVPGEGAYSVPLWKVEWEKARQWVLLKKYPEAILAFRQALGLKPNLDEARQELVQVLVTLERWGEAVTELELLAEHHPTNQKVQKELAELLTRKKEYRRAIERYQWLLQKDPENLQIHLSLAANYYQINELEKALIEWRQVLIRDPQNVEARTHLAEVLSATRRIDESILLLEGLVKQFPKNWGLKKKLAQALVSTGRNKEALPHLQEIYRHDPGDLEIQLSLAQVLSAGKHYDQSLTYLDTYLKKKPDHSDALLEKARALLNTGSHIQALEVYQKLKKMEADNLDLQREIAEAYFSAGKTKEALAEFEALVKHFPGEYQLYEKIGELYFQNKNYNQAIYPFQKALSLEPDNMNAQLNLARSYNFSGEKEKALPFYRSILSKRMDMHLQMELADLLFEMQQFPESLRIYQRILENQPDLWEVRLKLATGLYRQKEFDQAALQLETLIQGKPDQASIWTLSGYNALEQGDYTLAQKAFQKVLTLGEDRGNILLRLGELARLQHRPWKGINYLDWALTMKPGAQELLIEKAMALIDGGGLALARRILEPMVQSSPKDFKVLRAWIRLLAALDRRDEMEAGWGELEKNFPLEQELIYQDRADFYLGKNKLDLALTALKKAQRKNPKHLAIQRKIGHLLFQMGQWKDVEVYYQNLEKNKTLLGETYLTQTMLAIQKEDWAVARERLWAALLKIPDSVRIRFYLWRLYEQDKTWQREANKIEETLEEYSRNLEGGLLELADCYREVGNWKKALEYYQELIDRGEDDDVLLSSSRVSDFLKTREKTEQLQRMLEDLQKRFPRNQKITRQLIEHYTQEKEYGQAVNAIDSLLKIEDSLDPVLIVKKARILDRWHKHGASQTLYQKLLDPPVDLLFREKVKELFLTQEKITDSLGEESSASKRDDIFNPFFEATKERMNGLPLTPVQKDKLDTLIEGFKTKALIQKKVYLEKEGKDRLWRNQFTQARPFLEALKGLDPDNEDVYQDISRSYRLLN